MIVSKKMVRFMEHEITPHPIALRTIYVYLPSLCEIIDVVFTWVQ
jgi:hypothetical protein